MLVLLDGELRPERGEHWHASGATCGRAHGGTIPRGKTCHPPWAENEAAVINFVPTRRTQAAQTAPRNREGTDANSCAGAIVSWCRLWEVSGGRAADRSPYRVGCS
jgi:hypothetical protein